MTTETNQNDWATLKGKIKTRFGKLTDESIESMKGNLELLSGKLQTAYGYAKDQADREFAGFKATLHSATAPTKQSETSSKAV